MMRRVPGAVVPSLVPDGSTGACAPRLAPLPVSCAECGDALLAIPFEELVRRRLRPVVETLAGGAAGMGIYRDVLDQVERALVDLALEATGGNQQRAAGLLGINRNTLRTKRSGSGRPAHGRA